LLFVLGSDEMNIRLWKAKAWEKLGLVKDRQRTALEYNEKLKEKFASHPEVNYGFY
jgi:WD repeat and SOF domain-containing protein 1